MGNQDDVYAKWRNNAARQYADDRFTILFEKLVDAWRIHEVVDKSFEYGVYLGLREAYCLVTGDSRDAVDRQVAGAVRRLIPS